MAFGSSRGSCRPSIPQTKQAGLQRHRIENTALPSTSQIHHDRSHNPDEIIMAPSRPELRLGSMLGTAMLLICAVASIVLPLLQVEHAVVLEHVYLNGQGPFRMLLDTGAQSSSITPQVARRIGAEPRFRVEHVTIAGSRIYPEHT